MKNRMNQLSIVAGLVCFGFVVIANAGPYAYERPLPRTAAPSGGMMNVHTASPPMLQKAQESSARAVVNYATNKSNLDANARATLDNLLAQGSATASYGMGSQAVVINANVVGHTDSRGSRSSNQALSVSRANGVGSYLSIGGVHPSKINSSGQGESSPIASNRTRTGRAQNRRTEVDLLIARNR